MFCVQFRGIRPISPIFRLVHLFDPIDVCVQSLGMICLKVVVQSSGHICLETQTLSLEAADNNDNVEYGFWHSADETKMVQLISHR